MIVPRVVLLDLDDTIVDDTSAVNECWMAACSGCPHAGLTEAIRSVREWYWSDPGRHRVGRLDMPVARRHIVRMAMGRIGLADEGLIDQIASRYGALRDERLALIPGAIETVQWFRESGCRTALLTNGAGSAQRVKIARFGLEPLFDLIVHTLSELRPGRSVHSAPVRSCGS